MKQSYKEYCNHQYNRIAQCLDSDYKTNNFCIDDYMSNFSIEYYLNRFCFRHVEDYAIDKFKIMCVGCSFTFGYILEEQYTWPYILEKQLNDKIDKFRVYNFGRSGISIDACAKIAYKFKEIVNPDLIIFLLPPIHRDTFIKPDNGIINFLFDKEDDNLLFYKSYDLNNQNYLNHNLQFIRQILGNTPCYFSSWHLKTYKHLEKNYKQNILKFYNTVDYCQDLKHPGGNSNQLFVNSVVECLTNNNHLFNLP